MYSYKLWVKMHIGKTILKSNLAIFTNVSNKISFDPKIPYLGSYFMHILINLHQDRCIKLFEY